MYIPTPSGVTDSGALLDGDRVVFGTLDLAGDPVALEPCAAASEPYSGELVDVLGVPLPASTEVAMADRTWRTVGSLAQGDAILCWTQGEGVMEPYVLPTPVTSRGDATRIVAPMGCLMGSSETGPWILVR